MWAEAPHQLLAFERCIENGVTRGSAMRTCWVLDHPAHVRLLAPFLRAGQSNDVIIATQRSEVEAMLAGGDGHIPRRQTHWVERPLGPQKRRIALNRWRSSHAFLRQCMRESSAPIERVVAVGASIELLAWRSPVLRRRLSSIKERWYISDTEVNHIAHRLALKSATHFVLPTHWDESIDGGLLKGAKTATVHRLNGLHGHIHLRPSMRPSAVSNPPRVLVRRLVGDGIHDGAELIDIPESTLDGLLITQADEGAFDGDPWSLVGELSAHDGVITQSVTLASEAALLGVPTLLVSAAKRGFLDRLQDEGYPLFRWTEACEGDAWHNMHAQYLTGLHLTEALEPADWPDARRQLATWLDSNLID